MKRRLIPLAALSVILLAVCGIAAELPNRGQSDASPGPPGDRQTGSSLSAGEVANGIPANERLEGKTDGPAKGEMLLPK